MPDPESSRILDRIRVVLVSTRNPLNIGAAARAMSNFGFSWLRVVHPYEAAFRTARSAVGAEELLASADEYDSIAAAVTDCTLVVGTTAIQRREARHPLYTLQQGASKILQEAGDVAILFGSEKRGLSNEDLSHCHWLMHIPTGEQQPSINLGQAVAICLYELTRNIGLTINAPDQVRPMQMAAASQDLERTTQLLLRALRSSGYFKRGPTQVQEESMRRLVHRLHLSAEDVTVWLGILRQILWKLETGP